MSLLTRMLKQQAAYWPPDGLGDRGEVVHGEAVEIKCRWEDVHESFLDARGTEQMSNAKVYADRDLEVGGLLRLGELDEVPFPMEPRDRDNGKVYEIRKFEKLPDLKAKRYLRTAML